MSQQAQAIPGATAGAGAAHAGTLRAELDSRREGRAFDVRAAVGLIVPLCTQLATLHGRGGSAYVHPSSLRFTGSALEVIEAAAAQPPTNPHDQACLAPEIRKGGAGDARASVFAIGALLYEMLTGESVGPGMRRPAEVVPDMPPALEAVLGKALVSDAKHRPADLAALAQALHQVAPGSSIAPPAADASHLDKDGDFEVDIRMSMIPPNEMPAHGYIPKAPNVPKFAAVGNGPYAVIQKQGGEAAPFDPTRQLADLKARLESDPRPRYVVIKDGMDHGPFSAVELLQQLATGTFTSENVLRDSISGAERFLSEWDEFAPFAQQAKLNRDIKEEKKAFEATVVKEKQGTQYKALGGAIAVGLVAAVIAGIVLRERANHDVTRDVQSDQAVAVDVDGGLAGQKNGPGAVGGPRPGGGSYPVLGGGMSCEGAQAKYVEEIKMSGGQPDLTAGQFGNVLNRGSYMTSCNVPSSMEVNICAAVQNGRAVGVTVTTSPPNGGVASCVSSHVRGLSFPSNPKLDIARTRFAAN